MVLKGYYPSASLGFEWIISTANSLVGLALVAIGALTIVSKAIGMVQGPLFVGLGATVLGIMCFVIGVMAIVGSCQDSVKTLRVSYIISIFLLVAAGGLAGYCFAIGGNLNSDARHAWFTLSGEQKELIQGKYACCGFTSTREGTEGCESELSCGDPWVGEIAGRVKIITVLSAVAAAIQLLAIGCGACVSSKMREQQAKKMRKAGLTLQQESAGGYKEYHHGRKIRKHGKK